MLSEEKLLRALIREQIKDLAPEKLRVLDFDDTIAYTTERVRVETPGIEPGYKMISSEEFAIYDLAKDEYFDPDVAFTEFSKVDINLAEPVSLVADLLTTFVKAAGNRKVLILTARGPDVEPFVMEFLEKKLGIKNPSDKIDFVGVNSKDPMAKVRVIKQYLQDHSEIKFVSFYDDSGKNVNAVKAFIDKLNFRRDDDEKIRNDIRRVVSDEEGNVRLVKPEDE